jgi:hypothetical protein
MPTVCPNDSNLAELLRRPPLFIRGVGVVPVQDLLRPQSGALGFVSGQLRGRIFRTPYFAGRRLVAEGTLLRPGISQWDTKTMRC